MEEQHGLDDIGVGWDNLNEEKDNVVCWTINLLVCFDDTTSALTVARLETAHSNTVYMFKLPQ